MIRFRSCHMRQDAFGFGVFSWMTRSHGLFLAVALCAAPAFAQTTTPKMTCAPSSSTASPGTSVTLDLFLEDAVDVRGYQATIAITRTSGSGEVTIPCPIGVDVDEDRPDFIFPDFDSENLTPDCPDCGVIVPDCEGQRVAVARVIGGVDVADGPANLATYTLDISPSATPGSEFRISIVPYPESILATSGKAPIPFNTGPGCTIRIPNICGNNIREDPEQCDGTDDAACPGKCLRDCTCPIPTVSGWGLIALTLFLLAAISIKFGRRGFGGATNGGYPLAAFALFLALPVASASAQFCESDVDCNDGNVCTFDECSDGMCWNSLSDYGDIARPDGCGPDGAVDLFDIYAVEDGFEDIVTQGCTSDHADIKSANACEPDGAIDLFDLLAVLDAFAGAPNCECFPIGACCGEDGSCTEVTPEECEGSGGEPQGEGEPCEPGLCAPDGACCHGNATCTQETEAACNGANDTYKGDGILCADVKPTINAQPQNKNICKGKSATFTVTVKGTGTPHYEWKKGDVGVGGDSNSLTLDNVPLTDNTAQITCTVKDDCDDEVTSNAATLGVFWDAACPACAGAVASTLAVVEVGLVAACPAGACGFTRIPAAGTQVLAILTCLDDGPCNIEFRVTGTRDMESDPCPGAVTVISGGGDSDVTAANFCGMVDGFWNGGSGDGGGDCFYLGGTAYGQPTCTELHEDVHVADYAPLLNAELALLSGRPSMAPIPMDGNPPSQTCAQAEAARTAAITADVNTAYTNATTAWLAQGEGVNGWAAEFPCATNIAKSICQWAKNAATIDVDTCANCTNNALGTVYTDICGDGAVNQPSEQCDDGNTDNDDGCSATCQNEP